MAQRTSGLRNDGLGRPGVKQRFPRLKTRETVAQANSLRHANGENILQSSGSRRKKT